MQQWHKLHAGQEPSAAVRQHTLQTMDAQQFGADVGNDALTKAFCTAHVANDALCA